MRANMQNLIYKNFTSYKLLIEGEIMEFKSVVSIVKGELPLDDEKVYQMVKEAVNCIGGISKFIKREEKVLVFINMLGPFPPPTTTDPRVTKAVVRLCREAKPKEVVVSGEASAITHVYRGKPTRDAFEVTQTAKALQEIGCSWIPADEYDYEEVKIPKGLVARKVNISKLLRDYDAMVCVPVLHTGEDVWITLAWKLPAMGLLDDEYKFMWHRTDLSQKLCDVYRYIKGTGKYRLAVTDCLMGAEGGLIIGEPVELNLIFASDDPLASDVTVGHVTGIDLMTECPWGWARLTHFYGLGCGDISKIKTVGNITLEEAKKIHGPLRFPGYFIDGIFQGVDVIPGGVCTGCYWWARQFLEYSLIEGLLDEAIEKYGRMCIILGVSPSVPEEPEEIEGLPVVFGDCAIQHCFQHSHGWMWAIQTSGGPLGENRTVAGKKTGLGKIGKPVLVFPGCPPLAGKSLWRKLKEIL